VEGFVEELRGLGVEVFEAEAGAPGGVGAWWRYPLDAWPLLALALRLGVVPPRRVVVARPGDVEGVVAAVRAAGRHGVCLLPRGGGSGVLGGLAPRGCCVVLDVSRLDWVKPRLGEGYVYAGAGAALWRVEGRLREAGYTTGLEPQSFLLASVGGLVSTLAAGALQPGYGNVEDVVLFVDLVDGCGRVLRLGGPGRPRVLGPGCGPLAVAGAEGGLGVVTGVGLRARRLPRHVASATYVFPGLREALEAARRLVQWNQPGLLRVIDDREASLLYGREGVLLLVAYMDDEDPGVPGALLGKAKRVAAALEGKETGDLYEEWLRKRYDYESLVAMTESMGLWFDTIDLQASWPRLAELHSRLYRGLAETPGVVAAFSHVSHFNATGGSLYVTVVVERRVEALAAAWRAVMEAARETGASATHHHGVGLQKLPWIAGERAAELQLYCGLKRVLDPEGVLGGGPSLLCRPRGEGAGGDREG